MCNILWMKDPRLPMVPTVRSTGLDRPKRSYTSRPQSVKTSGPSSQSSGPTVPKVRANYPSQKKAERENHSNTRQKISKYKTPHLDCFNCQSRPSVQIIWTVHWIVRTSLDRLIGPVHLDRLDWQCKKRGGTIGSLG